MRATSTAPLGTGAPATITAPEYATGSATTGVGDGVGVIVGLGTGVGVSSGSLGNVRLNPSLNASSDGANLATNTPFWSACTSSM